MILEYLSITQTLDYLEKETGYKYEFNNLKELSFAGKINCFFYGSYTIYNIKTRVQPAPFTRPEAEPTLLPAPIYEGILVRMVKGVFYVKDIFEKTNDDILLIYGNQIIVENIFEEILAITKEDYKYQQGDPCYLSKAGLLDIKFYDNGMVNSISLSKFPVVDINLENIRFKKSEIDYLIDLTKHNSLSQQVADLIAENEALRQQLELQATTPAQSDTAGKPIAVTDEYQHNQRKPVKHLLYALIKEQGLTLTEKGQGNANDFLFAITEKFNVPVTEGFLKSRLMELYDLEAELQNNLKNKK